MGGPMTVLEELSRRIVFRAAVANAAFAWLLVQVAETVFDSMETDE